MIRGNMTADLYLIFSKCSWDDSKFLSTSGSLNPEQLVRQTFAEFLMEALQERSADQSLLFRICAIIDRFFDLDMRLGL